MEGINQIVTGELISLSEQELLDCSTGSYGCKGGFTEKAFEYIIRHGGIDTEEDYPYMGFQTQCNAYRAKVVSIDGYERVPKYDERSLQKAVANQPVSVAIESAGSDFQHYASVSDFILSLLLKVISVIKSSYIYIYILNCL